ncbi:MAG: hypothetical protein PHW74_14890 [Desulfobacca sp.]|nr:hypothetical protein [Desulfobacca sp.]
MEEIIALTTEGQYSEFYELLRLSVGCYKSLRLKYPFRVRWTPEFEAWQRFLEEQVGAGALLVEPKPLYDPSSQKL